MTDLRALSEPRTEAGKRLERKVMADPNARVIDVVTHEDILDIEAEVGSDAEWPALDLGEPDGFYESPEHFVNTKPSAAPGDAERPALDVTCHEAYVNASSERDMAEAYYKTLETHLRQHGCAHDFAEVANADGRLAAAPGDAERLRKALLGLVRHDIDGTPCWCSTEPSRLNGWRHVQACLDATFALAEPRPLAALDVEAGGEHQPDCPRRMARGDNEGWDDAPCTCVEAGGEG